MRVLTLVSQVDERKDGIGMHGRERLGEQLPKNTRHIERLKRALCAEVQAKVGEDADEVRQQRRRHGDGLRRRADRACTPGWPTR